MCAKGKVDLGDVKHPDGWCVCARIGDPARFKIYACINGEFAFQQAACFWRAVPAQDAEVWFNGMVYGDSLADYQYRFDLIYQAHREEYLSRSN